MICTRNEFASIVGMSSGWVSKALDEGMPAKRSGRKGERVEIDTASAVPWLLDRASKDDGRRADSQRERLNRAQAERVELENAVRRGQLCEKADTLEVVLSAVRAHAAQRNGIASRLANELAGLTPAEIRVRILDELRRCDERFANTFGIDEDEPNARAAQEKPNG